LSSNKLDQLTVQVGRVLAWVCLLLVAGLGSSAALVSMNTAPLAVAPTLPVRIALKPLGYIPQIPEQTTITETAGTSEAVHNLLAEHRCLAQVMYYEARGDGEKGERAVAEVVFDRLAEGTHGSTLCDVVFEGAGQTFCQFTFVCDGSMDRPKDAKAWRAAQVLAARLMVGELAQIEDIKGATNYHAAYAHPAWASRFEEIAKIGNHIFYRAKTLTSPAG